jgi:uncharacterized protein (UPF0548 family)
VHRDVVIGAGRTAFQRAADGLFGWHMHRTAGFAVASSGQRAMPGTVVILRAGPAVAGLTIPCRVVYVVEEADRRGFAYGTLPGHPEQGEEAFLVSIAGNQVRFGIRAFSRPAWLLARAGGPFTRVIQQYATDRYVQAARRISERGAES